MTTESTSSSAGAAGASVDSASSNASTAAETSTTTPSSTEALSGLLNAEKSASATPAPGTPGSENAGGATAVVGADGKVSYVPNFKYRAAGVEKEVDPFFHGLIKDAESEKKVKDFFTKADAFEFVNGKNKEFEKNFGSLQSDYNQVSGVVSKFNGAVASDDLSSAFRLAGITKEKVFQWTQKQLQIMDMPPEQRQQHEQFEQATRQKSELEEKVQALEQKYQGQAVQARTMQLDSALSRPDVAKFADAWDRNTGPGSFKNFVVEQAQQVYYTSQQDISPEQAVQLVMQRFGKLVNVGETAAQSSQVVAQAAGQQQTTPPVIPNVPGKAASPIKKVPRSIDDLKKLAREARDNP